MRTRDQILSDMAKLDKTWNDSQANRDKLNALGEELTAYHISLYPKGHMK